MTALRRAYGIPGMQVLQFLVDREDFDLSVIEEDCVCYTGTHDNDTTVGWFESGDGEQQPDARARWQQRVMRNAGSSREDIHKCMIKLAFYSRSPMAIATMQDYLGLGTEARMNRPGEPGGHWRWRLDAAALDDRAHEDIRAMIASSGRDPWR